MMGYGQTKKAQFDHDFGLKGQIHDKAGLPREMFTPWNVYPVKCLPREMRRLFHWGEAYFTGA